MSTATDDIKIGLAVAGEAATFIPNPLAQAIIILAARYGPGIIDKVDGVLSKPNITIDDMRAIFADLKPWESFGIPDKAPPPTT